MMLNAGHRLGAGLRLSFLAEIGMQRVRLVKVFFFQIEKNVQKLPRSRNLYCRWSTGPQRKTVIP